jgi:hypothetical protein
LNERQADIAVKLLQDPNQIDKLQLQESITNAVISIIAQDDACLYLFSLNDKLNSYRLTFYNEFFNEAFDKGRLAPCV